MNARAIRGTMLALGLVAAGAALAQPGPGYGRGPGAGYGPGMMGGGYGPGMMGGYGPGYGPGMMGGGYGRGGGIDSLDLTAEQQQKIAAIQEDNRRKNWDTMGKMRAEQFKLRSMYNADDVNPKAFAEQQQKVDELRREMIVSRLQTRKQVENVLTPEQRKQFRQFGPRWLEDGDVE